MRGDPREAVARARELLPKPVKYETIRLPEWGAADVDISEVKLLPGRVIVRVKSDQHSDLIWLPTVRAGGLSLGLGEVVAMGPPARTRKGHPIPPGFKVGDILLHQAQHTSRSVPLRGETLRAVAQAEVVAVILEGTVTDTHDGRPLADT
jgi:co-chaperonin GroES (HSP10)